MTGSKGRFILSINDVPEIRETFGAFQKHEVVTTYVIATKAGTATGRKELVFGSIS